MIIYVYEDCLYINSLQDKSAVKANGHANGAVKEHQDGDVTPTRNGHLNGHVNRFQNTFNKFTTEMCNPALNSHVTRQRVLHNGAGGNK